MQRSKINITTKLISDDIGGIDTTNIYHISLCKNRCLRCHVTQLEAHMCALIHWGRYLHTQTVDSTKLIVRFVQLKPKRLICHSFYGL